MPPVVLMDCHSMRSLPVEMNHTVVAPGDWALCSQDSKKVAARNCLVAGYAHHPLRPSRGRPLRDRQQKALTAVVKVHNQNRRHFGCYSSSRKVR